MNFLTTERQSAAKISELKSNYWLWPGHFWRSFKNRLRKRHGGTDREKKNIFLLQYTVLYLCNPSDQWLRSFFTSLNHFLCCQFPAWPSALYPQLTGPKEKKKAIIKIRVCAWKWLSIPHVCSTLTAGITIHYVCPEKAAERRSPHISLWRRDRNHHCHDCLFAFFYLFCPSAWKNTDVSVSEHVSLSLSKS